MDANAIGHRALRQRYERASHNRHNEDAGTVAGQRTELRHAQRENAGEHDGVEESDQDDAPHGNVASAQHGDRYEHSSADGAQSQQSSGSNLLQQTRTNEAANHRTAPIKRDQSRGNFGGQSANFRLAKVVHQKAGSKLPPPHTRKFPARRRSGSDVSKSSRPLPLRPDAARSRSSAV